MGSHLLPLGVRQDSPNHLQAPQKELESQSRNSRNPESQQTLVYRDNGLHKALVNCRQIPGKIFVGGKEYRIDPERNASARDKWKNDLWRAVCLEPPIS